MRPRRDYSQRILEEEKNHMIRLVCCVLKAAILVGAAVSGSPAIASTNATGIWIDHTGRGAVEIKQCGKNLCGNVVWLEDSANAEACGLQVLGNVKPVARNRWDNGWIYDPDEDAKYDVEITVLRDGKLKILGYAGTKWFSETMFWTRAPVDLKLCKA
jgi:uncharacterized protein (DUF2147 family)